MKEGEESFLFLCGDFMIYEKLKLNKKGRMRKFN